MTSAPITLRPYQRSAIGRVRACLHNRPILVAPTGSGKTVMAVALVKIQNGRTLWLAHRKELIEQAASHLESLGLWPGIILAGHEPNPLARVHVASVQTLNNRDNPPADLVVVDECFPAGTDVGGKPIETIRVGDSVPSWDGKNIVRRKVTRRFQRLAGALVRVALSDGRYLICTPNHPVFDFRQQRYISAIALDARSMVLYNKHHDYGISISQHVYSMWACLHGDVQQENLFANLRTQTAATSKNGSRDVALPCVRRARKMRRQIGARGYSSRSRILFGGVQRPLSQRPFVANDGQNESQICLCANESQKPNTIARNTSQNFMCHAGARDQKSRRQRQGADGPRKNVARCAWVDVGISNTHQTTARIGISNMLQSRSWESCSKNRYRSRREFSSSLEATISRSQKGGAFSLVGVDRVEVLEPGSDRQFGGVCPDGYVYNIEVDQTQNYFADGILVHNCHHVTGASYRAILDAYPNAAIVGLTATPFRLDGRGLGDVFGEIVIAAYTDELCADGTLHEPRVYAGATPDLRGVKTSMGDYQVSELSRRSNRPELNADVVETWKRHAAGKRTVAFAVDVEHSRAICAAFQAAGVRAAHLDGTTAKSEREYILNNLRTGFLDVVSNCMVLTEGWDLPALECAIVARPTASLNLHLQMLGRIMRAADGKSGAIVLDHAGNHHIHGRVTRRITYSLDGRIAGESDPLGLRRCRACQLLFDPREPECPECGWKPEPATGRERPAIHGAAALTEFDDTDYAYRAEMWRLFEAQREAAGYKPGWSAFRFNERFGEWPVVADGELVDVAHATMEQKRAVYSRFVEIGRAKGFQDGWASHRYRAAFGSWPRGFVNDVRGDARERIAEKLKGR